MARMDGIFVWKCSLITTRPRSSIWTPTSSKPSPLVKGTRPTETRTTSASISSEEEPSLFSILIVTAPLAFFAAEVTFDPILNSIPCFCKIFLKFDAISSSAPAAIESINSTAVTFEPSRFQTDPNSKPITPAPTKTNLLGTSLRERAPVEETIFSSSISRPGMDITSEPVAIRIFFVFRVSDFPSRREASTSLGPVIFPVPFTYRTLFFLKRNSIPDVKPFTDFSFCFIILVTSHSTGPPTVIPYFSRCEVWWYK
mmetsp:Transcript_36291/g.49849  ORF Transcript_36291/g.49849 Transcript_36291/m.49849 type:complete len:256 (+) Transcript_36291:735-1502(+)